MSDGVTATRTVLVKSLGKIPYETTWKHMQDFTQARDGETPDEIWVVEHPPVYTQGQAGKAHHLLRQTSIPVVQTDRGGQVTYHGPGQLVVYPLLDLKRLKLGVRDLVSCIENSVIACLAGYQLTAKAKPDAPGVYVDGRKIASLGLRVRKGCSFHGVAINLAMDLNPFADINPCGYPGLTMTTVQQELGAVPAPAMAEFSARYITILARTLQLSPVFA